jgi:Fis family transcriptional regulator
MYNICCCNSPEVLLIEIAIGLFDLINNNEVKMTVIDTQATTQTVKQEQGLQDLVYNLVTRFLVENKNKPIEELYDMILSEVEPPLLQAVMEKRRGNQLQAAKMLGISRGTIRKKLHRYFGTKYFRLTDE